MVDACHSGAVPGDQRFPVMACSGRHCQDGMVSHVVVVRGHCQAVRQHFMAHSFPRRLIPESAIPMQDEGRGPHLEVGVLGGTHPHPQGHSRSPLPPPYPAGVHACMCRCSQDRRMVYKLALTSAAVKRKLDIYGASGDSAGGVCACRRACDPNGSGKRQGDRGGHVRAVR